MRRIFEAIKRNRLYRTYLVDTAVIRFLRRIKNFIKRIKESDTMKKYQRHDQILPLLESFIMPKPCEEETHLQDVAVDVIVPIYNGYEYLVKLFEDLPRTNMKCRFILVDDKSTDARVLELEEVFVKEHENAILLKNETNGGFVKSVNHGLRESIGHVALVNTDTELPQGWLERLMLPIVKDSKIATTTPYSNSATIFSFPDFCYNNPIYRDLAVDRLDAYFKRVKPSYVKTPTGVGFCMGMNRKALDEIGLLDEETYGRGYGEENDWCQRAQKRGYSNVQVENLFVYHKHGGSFLSEEKERMIAEHMEQLRKAFPNYESDVGAFIRKDPNGQLRNLLEMLIDTHETPSVLYFDHNYGGGANSYLNLKKEEFIRKGYCVSVIRFDYRIHVWTLWFENERGVKEYEIWSKYELQKVLSYFHYDEIYINELVSHPDLWEVQEIILAVQKQQNSKLIMLCHDLFAICPTINLLNNHRQYCGMPEEECCNQCFLQKKLDEEYACKNRKEWNANWKSFLLHCTEVRAFSKDTLQRMKDTFGEELAYTLVPHQVDYAFPIDKCVKTTKTVNIGLIGVLSIHKGGELIEKLLRIIEKENLNICIKLIGYCDGINLNNYSMFSETGPYQAQELPKLVYENDIDCFFIASVWPETFSYTTEEIIKMGMPIVALNIGAPAERVQVYEKGLVLDKMEPEELLAELQDFAEKNNRNNQPVEEKGILYLAEYISFSSRYRMEHLREEMLYQGIAGQVMETSKIPRTIDWEKWGAVVIYRCRYKEQLPGVITEAKAHGVPVLYDIDDYIFDYDAIRELPFMKDEEYKDFEQYSKQIRQCMEASDGIIVSTNHMKMVVQQAMPQKPVYINRNVASAEMMILSAKAQNKKNRTGKQLILGYFSGSNTHSRDFELIEDVLVDFLKAYPNAYLKVVGCLELSEKFREVKERIIREGFMEWQKLPESIARVDINLMPLENTLFHKCKSENKWMEAALVRVPTIGSWNEEIAAVTQPGEDILLCRDAKEWMESLVLLAENEELRNRIAENAYQYVIRNKTTLQKDEKLLEFVMNHRDLRNSDEENGTISTVDIGK